MDTFQQTTNRRAARRSHTNPRRRLLIGPLEAEAMKILWSLGEGSVRDVLHQLSQPAAYTTMMTTLTRLFLKGLLTRRKVDRRFVYRPSFTAEEWHRRAAMQAALCFLSTPDTSQDLLLSCLQEALALQGAAGLPSADVMKRRDKRYLGVKRTPLRHSYFAASRWF
jgi:predicted transcriptional regulator